MMFGLGSILDRRYRLDRCLGQAPARYTWLATDQQTQEQVVLKILTFSGAIEWQDLKLFEREARVLRQLDHPNIPRYRDHFSSSETPSWFAIVQSYIPGRSLKQWIDAGRRLSETDLGRIATEVLQILKYLHGLTPRILHRDIKPSNLIWGEDDRIYLVDFGAVQSQAAAQGQTFTVVGTYGYTPLEQYGGQAVPASDLYALGATLIHLATGRSPSDLPQKDMKIQFRNQVDLDPNWIRWLEKLTDPDLNKRFQTADQALRSLPTHTGLSQQTLRIFETIDPGHPLIDSSNQVLRMKIPGMTVTPAGLAQFFLNPIAWIYFILLLATLTFGVRPLMGFWALLAAPLIFVSYFSLTKFLTVIVTLTEVELQMSYQLLNRILYTRSIPTSEIEEVLAVPVSDREENSRYKLMIRTPRGRYGLGARDWQPDQIKPMQKQISEWLIHKGEVSRGGI